MIYWIRIFTSKTFTFEWLKSRSNAYSVFIQILQCGSIILHRIFYFFFGIPNWLRLFIAMTFEFSAALLLQLAITFAKKPYDNLHRKLLGLKILFRVFWLIIVQYLSVFDTYITYESFIQLRTWCFFLWLSNQKEWAFGHQYMLYCKLSCIQRYRAVQIKGWVRLRIWIKVLPVKIFVY